MMSKPRYDLLVVGLGAMGSAVAYHGARLGLSVLGLDQYDPPQSRYVAASHTTFSIPSRFERHIHGSRFPMIETLVLSRRPAWSWPNALSRSS